jgi:predicted anti-sigma-YlaC factor YlaD
MECAACRDVVSAQLDGEATEVEVAASDLHLATCMACADHRDRVTGLHRTVRVAAADPVPDLTAAILASNPPTGEPPASEAGLWRLGLLLVAVAQLVAAVAHLGGGHIVRDQASWEAALAAGYGWAAWRPTRTAGLLPVSAVLTVLLLVNGGLALSGGGTHHLLAPLGLVFLVLATRGERSIRLRAA